MKPQVDKIPIEDTYCEAFDGLFARILITARDNKRLKKAAYSSTSLPCTVFGESEGGWKNSSGGDETPDGRPGAVIQIWVNYSKNAVGKLEYELAKRIRQGILVVPTTSVFDYPMSGSEGIINKNMIDTMERVGHCGDGYESIEKRYGREMINVPLMMGEFLIERYLSYGKGIMGGNVWFFCSSEDVALDVGDKAVDAIEKVDGAITSFDVCSAGSKVETKYPEIGPTTNHPYCPTLRGKIEDSLVADDVTSIPEIVINGTSLDVVKEAMRVAVKCATGVDGVLRISTGNYGGKLGRYKIYLRDI